MHKSEDIEYLKGEENNIHTFANYKRPTLARKTQRLKVNG